jgi:hypothetical protein
MSDKNLRKAAIKLAANNPGPIQDALLPLLTKTAKDKEYKITDKSSMDRAKRQLPERQEIYWKVISPMHPDDVFSPGAASARYGEHVSREDGSLWNPLGQGEDDGVDHWTFKYLGRVAKH